MDTKYCPKCTTTKPVSAFYLNKGRSDGLSGYCCECQRTAESERKARERMRLIEDLGGRCVECGFSDWRALQIDHVNGDGALDRAENGTNSNTAAFYRRVRENPERYALVCANCNWIKRHERGEIIGRRVYVRTEPQQRRKGVGRHAPEVNAARSESMRRYQSEHPEAEGERARKMGQKATGRKMVVREGRRTWAYPGDHDYPVPADADPAKV